MLDIRTYRAVPGGRAELVRIMAEEAVPMLRRYGVDVVAFGPSLRDDEHALLIRFFESMEERDEQLEGFYGSDEWLTRFDDRVMALIESFHTVVISTPRALATALASNPSRLGP